MKRLSLVIGLLIGGAAVASATPAVAAESAHGDDAVVVVRDLVIEVDQEATVLPGCSGTFVPMSFTGVNVFHARLFPDGTVSLSVQVREKETWTEDGLTHTVPFRNTFVFNRIDPVTQEAAVFTVALHGVGSASDGSTTTFRLIGHAVLAPDGSPRVDFTQGETQCGR
jgi:hypothetical protein